MAEENADYERGLKRGIEMAADEARTYNGVTSHPYDLGDCILGKLNMLPKEKIRKNIKTPKTEKAHRNRVGPKTEYDRAWEEGFYWAMCGGDKTNNAEKGNLRATWFHGFRYGHKFLKERAARENT